MTECGDLNIITGWVLIGLGVLFGMFISALLMMTKSNPDASHD